MNTVIHIRHFIFDRIGLVEEIGSADQPHPQLMQPPQNWARSTPEIGIFNRWVWRLNPCVQICHGSRGSDRQCIFSLGALALRKAIDLHVRRSFKDLSKSDAIPFHGALMRPLLKYGMLACLSNLVADVTQFERIQKLATRFITVIRHLLYEEIQQRLGHHSLQR